MTSMDVWVEDGPGQTVLAVGNLAQERRSNRWQLAIAILSLAVLCPTLVRAQSHSVQAGPKITEVLETAPLDIKDEDTQLIKLKKCGLTRLLQKRRNDTHCSRKASASFPIWLMWANESLRPKQILPKVLKRERRRSISSSKSSPNQKKISTSKCRTGDRLQRITIGSRTRGLGLISILRFCGKEYPIDAGKY